MKWLQGFFLGCTSESLISEKQAKVILTRPSTLESADGAILFTPESYEPEAVAAFKAWFAGTGRPAYVSGPLLPSASKKTANESEKKLSPESAEIQEFLDNTLKTSGEKSLLYVSPMPSTLLLVRALTVIVEPDLLWLSLLAGEDTREAVGFPRCCYGTKHPLRERITGCPRSLKTHHPSRFSATRRHSLSSPTSSRRRSRPTRRAYCLPGLRNSSSSIIRYGTLYYYSLRYSPNH